MNRPVMVSTWSFGLRGNAAAWPALERGGSSLDAVEHACRVVDCDEEVDSVGYGGLPDEAGRVTVDGCVMLSPARCGGAAVLSRHVHPVTVARQVMERTPHVMLAGPGADDFADTRGIAQDAMLAPGAKQRWEQWKQTGGVVDQSTDRGYAPPRPIDTGQDGQIFHDDAEARWSGHDTICTLALDAHGVLAGACSTSGMPFKVPGRVGDSPIIGHGLYVDPAVGAVSATGTGELIMGVCSAFLAVEEMRRGTPPLDALLVVLDRICANYELSDEHQVGLIALTDDGTWAGAALRPGFKISVTTSDSNAVHEPHATVLSA